MIDIQRNVEMTTRDGTVLRSDIYRPEGKGPWPVIMLRTPYDKSWCTEGTYADPIWYAQQGFIVVAQDTRGRYTSDGAFDPFIHEGRDGYDAVEWAAGLSGSNGHVGLYGASYTGLVQFLAAVEQPPHLGAIAPAVTTADPHTDWTYEGGALNLFFVAYWAAFLAAHNIDRDGPTEYHDAITEVLNQPMAWLTSPPPISTPPPAELSPLPDVAPYYVEWLRHPENNGFWQERSPWPRLANLNVPVLHIAAWYDTFLGGGIRAFQRLGRLKSSMEQQLVIGPWEHNPWGRLVGEVDFGENAGGTHFIDAIQVRFFKRHLMEDTDTVPPDPAVRYFLMFAEEWRETDEWPPSESEPETWFLHSGGRANTAWGDGELLASATTSKQPADIYQYHPRVPVPALGGHSCCAPGVAPQGPYSQLSIEQRADVLTYTTPAFEEEVAFAGPVTVELHVATTAAAADYTAKLCLVKDDTTVINVAEGIRRIMEGLTVDEPTRVEVDLRSTAFKVSPGERLRLEISSGAFPHWDRNPQTGATPAHTPETEYTAAEHLIYHTPTYPSTLTLPKVSE